MEEAWTAFFFAMGLLGLYMIENVVEERDRRQAMKPKRKHRIWMKRFLRRRLSTQRNTIFKMMDEIVNVSGCMK